MPSAQASATAKNLRDAIASRVGDRLPFVTTAAGSTTTAISTTLTGYADGRLRLALGLGSTNAVGFQGVGDMPPRVPADRLRHDAFANAVLQRQGHASLTIFAAETGVCHDGLRQLRAGVVAATHDAFGVLLVALSALRCHVSAVVAMCPWEHMARSHAASVGPVLWRITHVARMTRKYSSREGSIGPFVCEAMRQCGVPFIGMDETVAVRVSGSRPEPTTIAFGLRDLLPEAFCKGAPNGAFAAWWHAKLKLHVEPPFDVPCPRLLTQRAGSSASIIARMSGSRHEMGVV